MSEDTISRQAVIEINRSYHGQMPNEVNHRIWKEINELPSAQPKKRTEERTETHACDYINRKDAIDAHYEYCNKHPNASFPVWSLKILEDLPSAQPERTGRWIDHVEDGYVECPFCHSATNCDDNISDLHFCFSCGARMEGE